MFLDENSNTKTVIKTKNHRMSELIPGLPEEVALECLTRLPTTSHRAAIRVNRRWRNLIRSKEFYGHRKQTGVTHIVACLVQALPVQIGLFEFNQVRSPVFGLTLFNWVSGTWERLDPIPKFGYGLPLYCRVVSSMGKLVVMGGWDLMSYDPLRDVFVYDFTTRKWTQGRGMPGKRSFFAVGELDGRIIVAGGHDTNKNALSSAWAYDMRNDEWSELAPMTQGRDECEGLIVGSEFWVVSGYCTEKQGSFTKSVDVFNFASGNWKCVDDGWTSGQCPRSCAVLDKDGKLFNWAESELATQVGACVVDLGDQTLVTGSGYTGTESGFYLINKGEPQNHTLEKLDVSDEFTGFVQSGCVIEV